MEKKLKKVQRGAAVGFVLLKILRILLIIAVVALIAGLVFLAVVNENDLLKDVAQDGKLVFDLKDLELGQLGIEKVPDIGGLVKDGVLSLDLRDAKLALLMILGAAVLVLAALYVLLLVAGNLFKHMKKEDTPFTVGNIRRLRLLGALYIVFWACGIALSYFLASEFIRRLALQGEKVTLSLNLSSLLIALLFFFVACLFSFGKAQGEALQALQPAPVPVPAPVHEVPAASVVPAAPVPEPEPIPEDIAGPIVEPAGEPIVDPIVESVEEPVAELEPPATDEDKPREDYEA